MSAAARLYVETLPIKGAARDFLEAVAEHIPDGQTTTPPMKIPELATTARQHEKTARRVRDMLEQRKVIQVHDGGRGNVARYEVLGLTGTRPAIAAPLPLLGRPKPRTKEQRKTSDILPDLFDQTSDILPDVGDQPAKNVGHFARRLVSAIVNVGHFVRRWWSGTKEQRSTSDILPDVDRSPFVQDVAIDDASRARDVHTLQKEPVHTHTAAPLAVDAKPPPAIVHPWHAWCGRVCVPKQLHQTWLQKGHPEAWLFAFYARTCAATTREHARRVIDEFKFWRFALAAEFARPADADPRRADGIPNTGGCGHAPTCTTTQEHIERTLADARAARGRRSG